MLIWIDDHDRPQPIPHDLPDVIGNVPVWVIGDLS